MSGTTEQGPLTVCDLITKLKLVPLEGYIEVTNSDGTFYISNLEVLDDCTVNLILIKKE